MTSFQIAISPLRRAAAHFIDDVQRGLQMAFAEASREKGLNQSDIAREIGVHRSVINRQLKGFENLTLRRVAELAHSMGREAVVTFAKLDSQSSGNEFTSSQVRTKVQSEIGSHLLAGKSTMISFSVSHQ